MNEKGYDTLGRSYRNANAMWSAELKADDEDAAAAASHSSSTADGRHSNDKDGKDGWYSKGIEYWQGVEASVSGVLGGFEEISDIDIAGSDKFLREMYLNHRLKANEGAELRAVDCGAGVGRITKDLLLYHFNEVDVLEPCEHFLRSAEEAMTGEIAKKGGGRGPWPATHRPGKLLLLGLQEFTPEPGSYDVVWVQWVTGHLTDDDFVEFFKRCAASLRNGGLIFLKDNTTSTGFLLDKQDSSVTRSHKYIMLLLRRAGLTVVKHQLQSGFPEHLFPVRMYAILQSDSAK